MLRIENIKVYDLAESIVSSGYSMGLSLNDFSGRAKSLEFALNWPQFSDFVRYYNEQGKDLGQNTKSSCKKCGSSHKVQRVKNFGYYCAKHAHQLYRYGKITEPVIYEFTGDFDVILHVAKEKGGADSVVISAVDIPSVYGKNLHINKDGYLLVDGELFHRIIAVKIYGKTPEEVDHINQNKRDNRRGNLRLCSATQNKGNIQRRGSKITGVCYDKKRGKWRANIGIGYKQVSLGRFDSYEEAVIARLRKEAEVFGEFSPNLSLFDSYGISYSGKTCFPGADEINMSSAVKDFSRILRLSATPTGSGHQVSLSGIRVSFDLIYPNYISPELQRYHFFDIVTSSSKMHRLERMAANPECYNEYVSKGTIEQMANLSEQYHNEPTYENFMRLVSNCPQGIELFMRCSTNYLQLKTIYQQRHNHKLRGDWGAFCEFIEQLPYARELILA